MSTAQAGSGANLSTLIAPHLPYLRRYARSLTGTQTLGDGLVAKTIEALIDDRDVMDHSLSPRVGLYRLFTKIWSETPVETNAAVQLGPTPRSRQILLLTAVESFTLDDAALVLDVGVDKAEALKREGVEKLKQARHATVLIIEDEPIIALDIEGIVRGMGHDVVGVADTHSEAVRMAAETSPDLILADIQLADGSSGVEAVEEILSDSPAPVVFITAYPERLLTGDRVEPPFLITKPFRSSAVEAGIAQALFHTPASAPTKQSAG